MSFGQSRIELQRALAVRVRLLQPGPAGIELKLVGRAYKGEDRMGKRKGGVARDGVHQVLRSFFQQLGVARGASPVALDELSVSERIMAEASAALDDRFMKGALQGSGGVAGDIID